MIIIHAEYLTELWHPSEAGPAAVISQGVWGKERNARDQYEFAERLFSGKNGPTGGGGDLRSGLLSKFVVPRVGLVSHLQLAKAHERWNGILWMKVNRGHSATASIAQRCSEFISNNDLRALVIPQPKLIFGSWTLEAISRSIITTTFGGGAVFWEKDLFNESCHQVCSARKKHSTRDRDDEGEEWKPGV
jgi:hypothetical protein